jgi:hypothetical protein
MFKTTPVRVKRHMTDDKTYISTERKSYASKYWIRELPGK